MNLFSIFFINLYFTDRAFYMKSLDQLISDLLEESVISFEIYKLKQALLAKYIVALI